MKGMGQKKKLQNLISSLLVDTRNNSIEMTLKGNFFMSRKTKYTAEQKLWAVHQYLNHMMSASSIASALNMSATGRNLIFTWARQYKCNGVDAFKARPSNSSYTKEFKELVCQEYLSGQGGLKTLATRHGIPSDSIVFNWVKKYTKKTNELKDYTPQPEVYMAPRKKTTLEERRKIVAWYYAHGCSYKETAAHFECSYSQVRDWVIKFNEQGEEGLLDRRGKRVPKEELDENEQLRRELKRLQAINRHLEMENELLKKAEATERRWWNDIVESNEIK